MAGTGDPSAVWQKKLDRMFPFGAFWNPRYEGHPMPVAWVWVVSMEGLDPVLNIYPGGVDRMPWMGYHLLSMDETQARPLTVTVVFADHGHPVQWTAVTRKESMAARLAPWREYYQARSRGEYAKAPA